MESLPIVRKRTPAWQPTSVLVLDACNESESMVNVVVTFKGDGREVSVRLGLFPGWPTRLPIPLGVCDGGTLFLSRTPGRFKAVVRGANLRLADLEEIEVTTSRGAEGRVAFRSVEVCAAFDGAYTFPEAPLVDGLHQWRGREWPRKARTIGEVRAELVAELEAPAPVYPAAWSRFGGWNARRFGATGWFRTSHDGHRWWLVDPDGYAFWSIGVDCVRPSNTVNVTGIESVFAPSLPEGSEFAHLWQENDTRMFDALAHNLERALGEDWQGRWLELTRRRLLAYGFNTIGNWSAHELQVRARVPYVFTMEGYPGTATRLFRDFPDVYAEEFSRRADSWAAQLHPLRGDRYVLGYFMTNEPKWAFVNGFDLGAQILRDGRPSAARTALVGFLRKRYGDRIDALNRAWGSSLATFEDLFSAQETRGFPGSGADTAAFTAEAVERFVTIPAKACRRHDPEHLNLGLRWAWVHSDYQLAGAEHLDAFSINCYQLRPEARAIRQLSEKTGKPVIIGEFHIGALDRGLPSGGIRNTPTLEGSVRAYRHYIENAAAIPELIGAHYFKWDDQHVMGRHDGENMQIGLHDITARAYPEWREMCASVHPSLYEVVAGVREPAGDCPETVPDGTLCW
ncbi:MAG: hypothetical protein JXR77_01535 [Lentisphaeria bacterium]|nr:hypothetical protein [Lentisphaeria bacterium]